MVVADVVYRITDNIGGKSGARAKSRFIFAGDAASIGKNT